MTERLYYSDCYLKEFSGVVLEQRRVGENHAVILDQTAFYPTSGGQPHDTGMLGTANVVDVMEEPAGAILHVLDRQIPQAQVTGRIDWDRRFDHMQQHTGQHILSQAFIKIACAPTLSFHLGQETSTIDLDLAQLSHSLMEEAQTLATNVVFEDRSVHVLTVDRESLSSLGVRKETQREGEIRVIDVEGFDRSPCGGTHVRRSGEVGMIAILGYERYKRGTRTEFVCGGRALRALNKDHELVKQLGKLYSSTPGELPRLTEKLFLERAVLSRENARLHDQLMDMEADELFQHADKTQRSSIVRRSYAGRSLESVKALARKVATRPKAIAILGVVDTAQLVVSRSTDLPQDCNAAVKQVAATLGGRGGGKPELAQAGGFPAMALDSWLAALQEYFQD